MKLKKSFLLFFLLLECSCFINLESECLKGCDLAIASYFVYPRVKLGSIASFMHSNVVANSNVIISYNKDKMPNNLPVSFSRINIPFPCDCINGEFLGHVFEYSAIEGDTYDLIAKMRYSDLTTVEILQRFNNYDPNHVPVNAKVNVTVNCSCGNSHVSKDYGLFVTFPLRVGNTLLQIANQTKLDPKLLQSYNPGVNFSQTRGIVFIPARDQNGVYVPLYPSTRTGLAKGVAVGISIAGTSGVLLLLICACVRYFKKEGEKIKLPTEDFIFK
ncbi:lysM domain receptor-like kinase 3 isoform X1 [Arachis ipaensis]|uniref:lysM domain receptor-like kinase 3 isoform X1 n=1 Tax=Arachis ipaensis TaxID=130454 RepID=UPI000A2B88C5|nr:lysM domain receptor-like kinase 3 isoform X1 [Arachis ipaensis]